MYIDEYDHLFSYSHIWLDHQSWNKSESALLTTTVKLNNYSRTQHSTRSALSNAF